MPAAYRTRVRALDKKKPFLIGCENQARPFRKHLCQRFEEPGPDRSDDKIRKAKADKYCAERINQTASQLSKMLCQGLVVELFSRFTHNLLKQYYFFS